jgi:hypothetical protein
MVCFCRAPERTVNGGDETDRGPVLEEKDDSDNDSAS